MARTFVGNTANYLNAGDYDISPPYLTVSLWVRDDGTSQATLIGKWASTAQEWLIQGLDGSKHFLYATTTSFSGSYTIINGTGVVQPGNWAHVAMTQDASTLTGWLNGKYDGSGTARSWANSTEAIWIGRDGGGAPLSGQIAEVAVWNAALTPQEIGMLAQNLSPLEIRRTLGQLLIYLPMNKWAGGAETTVTATGVSFAMTGSVGFAPTPATVVPNTLPRPALLEGAATPPVLAPQFLNVGVGLFAPGVASPIFPPFLNVGVGVGSPMLLDGDPPPFVPPSLPPTLVPGTPTGPGVPLPPLSSGGLAGIRFYQGPPWRWVVTDLESSTLTFLDRLAAEAVVTYTLDKGATARLSVPADNPEVNILADDGDPFVAEGNRLLYGFRREGDSPLWVCRFAGRILLVEDSGLTEDARTTITAYDPWQLMYQRPMVRDTDGLAEFPDKAGFFSFDDTQVGVIALTFLRNTIIHQGELGVDIGDTVFAGMDPLIPFPGTSYWGGPYQGVWSGRTKSEFETTTQIDTDTQQGLMVGEVFDLMVQTGAVDFLLTPIYDPIRRPGYTHELSIYNRAGVQATDAIFAWDKPGRNVTQINALRDGTKRANTIRYYAEQGGPPVNAGIPLADGASILKYGESWHEEFWPSRILAASLAMAELQLELMKNGIFTVDVTPSPERAPFVFSEYWLGDTVPVYASNKMRQEITGFQRIYGIVLQIDENSYEQLPSLLVSPDTA